MFTESDLADFYGSERWYKHWMPGKLVYTDGIHFLVENGAAWLVDAVASYQRDPRLNKGMLRDFQIWELQVKNGKGVLTCKADDGHQPVITQNIEFTDFPLPEITLYVEAGAVGDYTGKILMLPRER